MSNAVFLNLLPIPTKSHVPNLKLHFYLAEQLPTYKVLTMLFIDQIAKIICYLPKI